MPAVGEPSSGTCRSALGLVVSHSEYRSWSQYQQLLHAMNDGTTWDCVVAVEDDAIMRFVDVNPEKSAGIMVQFREAPQDRGTEVIARTTSPGPGALTGVLTFKVLYRARALLMTGEVPTIEFNPSARDSDR